MINFYSPGQWRQKFFFLENSRKKIRLGLFWFGHYSSLLLSLLCIISPVCGLHSLEMILDAILLRSSLFLFFLNVFPSNIILGVLEFFLASLQVPAISFVVPLVSVVVVTLPYTPKSIFLLLSLIFISKYICRFLYSFESASLLFVPSALLSTFHYNVLSYLFFVNS